MNSSFAVTIATFLALFNQSIARIFILSESGNATHAPTQCYYEGADIFDIGKPENLQIALKMAPNNETIWVRHAGASYRPAIINGTLVKEADPNKAGYGMCYNNIPDISESKWPELQKILSTHWPHPGNAYMFGFQEIKKIIESYK